MSEDFQSDSSLTFTLGHEQIIVRRRYEAASIANDFSNAVWFLVGSILFLFPTLEKYSAWLFIIGSLQFLARPTIRLLSHLHVKKVPESRWQL